MNGFHLLGPVALRVDGQEAAMPGKQRALLAALLVNANEVVSTDRLIDALWGEEPPARAAKALQVHVSQLRKLLSGTRSQARLLTHHPGYVLEIDRDSVDALRFERLADEGRLALSDGLPELAAARLREGLALWRGPALADLTYEAFAQPHIARLEELRLAAIEDRVDAELALGRHAPLAGELEALLAANPLRERLRGQLMLALYRAGRQADALSVFQQGRRLLVDELGLEPGPKLRELERAILAHEASLAPPSDGAARSPSLPPQPTPEPAAVPRELPARETRRTVSALHVQLAIDSADGGLDPEVSRRVVARALEHVTAAVSRHGGTLDRAGSDTANAVFGVPVAHEDDALRALRAADEARRGLVELSGELAHGGVTLEARLGVSTGQVVSGGGSQAPSAGAPLTAAPGLAASGGAGDVVLDDSTLRIVRPLVTVEPLGSGGLRLVQVTGAELRSLRAGSPMVGRARELRRLRDAFEQAVADSTCQLFTVLGAAGVGKSRLVHELVAELRGEALVARGRCLPYGEGITFWPLLEAVGEAAGFDEADSVERRLEKLEGLVESADEAETVAHRVAQLIGLAAGQVDAEGGLAAVRSLLETLGRERPVVVVFDDVHWGEPTFLDLVEHLADWIRDAAVLIACVARPEVLEIRPGWGGGKVNATSVLLEPLSAEECSQLVENLAGQLSDTSRARVVQAADGNPLFIEEMLALALESGDDALAALPPTIGALLAARLDLLDDAERLVLERASIEGKSFHEGSVVRLSAAAEHAGVPACLDALLRKDLIRPDRALFPGERAFRFRHLLIRDAAYESVPKHARATHHEQYADWLERTAGTRLPEYEEIVGYHLEQAFRYRVELAAADDAARALGRRAAERLGAAGGRACARSDAEAAVNLFSRAAAMLEPGDPLRVDLIPSSRVVQGMGAHVTWADAVLADVIEGGDDRLRAHALVQRGFLRLFTAPDVTPEDILEVAEPALETFSELGDELGLARGWRLLAQTRYLARRAAECVEASERALEHARRAGDRFEQREIVEWLGVALWLGPTPAPEGAHRVARLLELADDPYVEVHLLATLGYLTAIQGDVESALRLMGRGEALMRELGELLWLFPVYSAGIGFWRPDADLAHDDLWRVYEQYKRTGEQSHFSSVATILAQAEYRRGHFAEADRLAEEAQQAARSNDIHSYIVLRGTRGKVLARGGDLAGGELLAREAVAFAETTDFLDSHAGVLLDLGEILARSGRPDEASAASEQALRLYEQKGNSLGAAHARSVST